MISFSLLVTAIGVVVLGVMITSVAVTVSNDRRRNDILGARWAEKVAGRASSGKGPYLRATEVPADRRRQALPAPAAAAIGAGNGVEAASTNTTASRGSRVQLSDGRTGTVLMIEPGAQATRVHLDLDTGERGYVDLPGTAGPEPAAQPRPVPRPLALVPALPARSAAPVAALPAAPAVPAPAAAPVTAASSTTVRLGGFSMRLTRADERS